MTHIPIPTEIKEKRQFLAKVSKALKPYVEKGTYPSLNEAIIDAYRKRTGCKHFLSFKNWKKQGFAVQKEAVGFPIWSRPQKSAKVVEDENGKQKKTYSFFSVANVFNEDQVTKKTNTRT